MLQLFFSLLFHLSAPNVSTIMCHPQGARLYLLNNTPIWVLVDKLCAVYTQPHTTQNVINQNPNWNVTQKVQTSSLRMVHSCRNM
jgi:hypothetical protein